MAPETPPVVEAAATDRSGCSALALPCLSSWKTMLRYQSDEKYPGFFLL